MDRLIEILKDRLASLSDRDDAAMDLSDHDDSIDILISIARDDSEDNMILSSCGASIAEIWKRRAVYDTETLASLTRAAQSEIKEAFGKP